jgi:hypothetical protein
VWRDAPQGRHFVAGFWTHTADGWCWVPGYWSGAPDAAPLVPEPPAPLDSTPPTDAPDDNSTFIPGTWVYQNSTYAWQPGYWAAFRPGQVWVPAQYFWTPNGYRFNSGYWDRPFENRGMLFAPVAFNGSPWLNPYWCYTPGSVVNLAGVGVAAFYRPRTGHLYFGNYFDAGHAARGFRPWFTGTGRYDPAFAHYAWQHRTSLGGFAAYQRTYQARATGSLAPSRTPLVTPLTRTVRPVAGTSPHVVLPKTVIRPAVGVKPAGGVRPAVAIKPAVHVAPKTVAPVYHAPATVLHKAAAPRPAVTAPHVVHSAPVRVAPKVAAPRAASPRVVHTAPAVRAPRAAPAVHRAAPAAHAPARGGGRRR